MAYEEFLLGKRERMSWAEETSFGAGGVMSSGDICGLNATMEPDFNQNWTEIMTAGADGRTIENRVLGPLDLPFTLTFTPVDWSFLKYLGYSVVDAGSDPYTHTYTIANSIQSFLFEWALRATTPVVIGLTGCTVLGGTIAFTKATGDAGEGLLQVTLRCVAKSYSIGSSVTTLSNISRVPFKWNHVKLTVDNNEIAEVNSGEIAIDQGIDVNDSRYCNTTLNREIGEPIPKTHRLTGRASVNLKDNTFPTLWATGAVIANTQLEFIEDDTDNKLVAVLGSFRLNNGFSPTDLESVSVADMPFTFEEFSSLVATDTLSQH